MAANTHGLPHWPRRIAWFLREILADRNPRIPFQWVGGSRRTPRLCACCGEPAIGAWEGVPFCRKDESEILAVIAAVLDDAPEAPPRELPTAPFGLPELASVEPGA